MKNFLMFVIVVIALFSFQALTQTPAPVAPASATVTAPAVIAPVAPAQSAETIIAIIIGWCLACLALLRSIADFLHFIAAKTANTVDDKIAGFISSFCSFFGKLIDFFTANTRPKEN